jgi:AbrB family looped-hinge helix DNA binding protein
MDMFNNYPYLVIMVLMTVEAEIREIQQGGRVTIPKNLRDKYGLVEGTKVRIKDEEDRLVIEIPAKLTSLYGLIPTQSPSDNPKQEAREHVRKSLQGEQ